VKDDKSIQTEKEITYDFRRDWAGKIAKLNCDDRFLIINNRNKSYIRKTVVYMQGESICAIKFFYFVNDVEYNTQLPIDEGILKKLTAKVFEARGNAYIHSFRIGLKEGLIIRLDITDSTGEKLSVGHESEGTVYYQFDIGPKERPLTMFQSFQHLGKDKYVLQSLGCEILD
jgi:hypothetical protein